jgi:hypothetical protein
MDPEIQNSLTGLTDRYKNKIKKNSVKDHTKLCLKSDLYFPKQSYRIMHASNIAESFGRIRIIFW